MRLPHGETTSMPPSISVNGTCAFVQARAQCGEVGNDEPDRAVQALPAFGRRQVELVAPDVDPHVVRAGHQIRIAREPERR